MAYGQWSAVARGAVATVLVLGGLTGCGGGAAERGDVDTAVKTVDVTYYYLPG